MSLKKLSFKFFTITRTPDILRFFKSNNTITVLCIHRVADEVNFAWPSISIETFKGILHYISNNYQVITLDEINIKCKKPKLILTFDDGYKDFIDTVLPLLQKYKFPSLHHVVVNGLENQEANWTQRLSTLINECAIHETVFDEEISGSSVNVKIVSENAEKVNLDLYHLLSPLEPKEKEEILKKITGKYAQRLTLPEMMTWQDLRVCIQNGVEIGSHSMTHVSLKHFNNENFLEDELKQSKLIIEKTLGTKIRSFAFPNGEFDENAVESAIKAGYEFVFTTESKLFKPVKDRINNSFLVPRITLAHSTLIENQLNMELFYNYAKQVL